MISDHASWCISEWHPTRDDCTCGAALPTLAHNLAIGAALCESFWLGGGNTLSLHFTGRDIWFPGCNRPVRDPATDGRGR